MDISEIRKGQKIYYRFGSGISKWKILASSENKVVLKGVWSLGVWSLDVIMRDKKEILENGVVV